jgi:hypothetical protein
MGGNPRSRPSQVTTTLGCTTPTVPIGNFGYGRDMGYRARQGKQPVDAEHAEDEAGQARLIQVTADTEVPAPSDSTSKPDIVTEDDGSGMAGGASGSSGGSGMPGHPDAAHR